MNLKSLKPLMPVIAIALVAFGGARLFAAITESSTNVPLAIPDNGNINSTLNFSVNGTITDVNLTVDITHTWNDDIELRLTSPSVGAQLLWQDCGGSGDNLTATIDQDAAAPHACPNAGPLTGIVQPTNGAAPVSALAAGTLNAFDTTASGGVWTLNVTDDSSICTGTLNAWSLTIDGAAPLPVELSKFSIRE